MRNKNTIFAKWWWVPFLMTLMACSTASQRSEQTNTVQINIFSEPPSLDPRVAIDNNSCCVLQALFDGLTRIDGYGNVINSVASAISVSADGLTYTITLKASKWSNGSDLTASDFVFAWKSILDPEFAGPYAYQLYCIKNAKAIKEGKQPASTLGVIVKGPLSLVVQLEQPTPYFNQLLAFTTYFPVCQQVVEKNPNWANDAGPNYVSNGPFMLTKWKHDDMIVMDKNSNYWDAQNVSLQGINMQMVNDSSTELEMFEKGELDWAGQPFTQLPMESLPSLEAQGRLQSFPVAGTMWYVFNTQKPPFNSKAMRRAFALAINRQLIVDKLLQGQGTPAMAVIPPGLGLDSGPLFKDNDVAGAQVSFAQGLNDLKITAEQFPSVTLSYDNSELYAAMCQTVQQQWSQAFNVPINLTNTDWKIYLQDLQNGQFQIARLDWLADFLDPINFLQIFEYTGDASGGNNEGQWANAQYTALVQQIEQTVDTAKRAQLMQQAQAILIDEMPVAPVYFIRFSYLKNPQLQNVVMTKLGILDLKWASWATMNGPDSAAPTTGSTSEAIAPAAPAATGSNPPPASVMTPNASSTPPINGSTPAPTSPNNPPRPSAPATPAPTTPSTPPPSPGQTPKSGWTPSPGAKTTPTPATPAPTPTTPAKSNPPPTSQSTNRSS